MTGVQTCALPISKLVNMGMEPETGTPEAFADYLKQEVAKWARVVKASGLRLDL